LVSWVNIKEYLQKEADSLIYKQGNIQIILKGRRINFEEFLEIKSSFHEILKDFDNIEMNIYHSPRNASKISQLESILRKVNNTSLQIIELVL